MARTSRRSAPDAACCPPGEPCRTRPPLAERPLLAVDEAARVVSLFKRLANDTRVRILHHVVRSGESTVTDLARALGMTPQAVSNQLARLSDAGMLASRRAGNRVFYRVVNGCVAPLLDLAVCLIEADGPTASSPPTEIPHVATH